MVDVPEFKAPISETNRSNSERSALRFPRGTSAMSGSSIPTRGLLTELDSKLLLHCPLLLSNLNLPPNKTARRTLAGALAVLREILVHNLVILRLKEILVLPVRRNGVLAC